MNIRLLMLFCSSILGLQSLFSYYELDRRSFAPLCPKHAFDEKQRLNDTWLSSCDPASIDRIRKYIPLIPRLFEADCSECSSCGGVLLNRYNAIEYPLDQNDAVDQIRDTHIQSIDNSKVTCENNSDNDINDHCEKLCWDGGYFRKWNHKYFPFFQHYLRYCSQNSDCYCYWSELTLEAVRINDSVYHLFKDLADDGLIDNTFSDYWSSTSKLLTFYGRLCWAGGNLYHNEDIHYYPDDHGMACSLTTYTFFYSQYHRVLLDIAAFIDSNAINDVSYALDNIYETIEDIGSEFMDCYNDCLTMHPHPKIYYERGLIRMHYGFTDRALEDIRALMELANSDKYKDQDILTSEMYQQEGEAYADLGQYDKAISALTKAIEKDPSNQEAYFHRAWNYFEIGNFEIALSDYIASGRMERMPKVPSKVSKAFNTALLQGLMKGGKEAMTEFVPSLLNSVYGAGTALWSFAEHPGDATICFGNACYEVGQFSSEYFKSLDWEKIDGYVEDCRRLCEKFDSLGEGEKGDLIGYMIGKYGVDIFAPGAVFKGVSKYNQLRNANRLCNLEGLALSSANRQAMIAASFKYHAERERFFKNSKIHWDRQNKHIQGKHNYIEGRSIFEHSDPQGLIEKFAGTGIPITNRTPFDPDYREVINFKEFIGYHVNDITGVKTSTTFGEIRYSKTGVHIVPSLQPK